MSLPSGAKGCQNVTVHRGSSSAAPAVSDGPGRGVTRVVRGFFVAQVCLALSVGSHAAAGGPVHLNARTGFAWLALSFLCVAAAQRRRRFAGIVTTVMASQVVLHLVMTPAHSQMDHSMHGAGAATAPDAAMIAGHVIAAVLASILLNYGEHLVWAVWCRARLPRVPSTLYPAPAEDHPALVPVAVRAPDDGRLYDGGATRRGPPGR